MIISLNKPLTKKQKDTMIVSAIALAVLSYYAYYRFNKYTNYCIRIGEVNQKVSTIREAEVIIDMMNVPKVSVSPITEPLVPLYSNK